LVEAVQQGAIGESHVGKAGGGDGYLFTVLHQEHLHDPLGSTHHIGRIGCLVG